MHGLSSNSFRGKKFKAQIIFLGTADLVVANRTSILSPLGLPVLKDNVKNADD